MGVLILVDELLVGVLARDETCCRDDLPLALEYLNVEGELDRLDTGLPWLELSVTLLANLGRREVADAGDVGDMGELVSFLTASKSGRINVSFDPARSLWAREWWLFKSLEAV